MRIYSRWILLLLLSSSLAHPLYAQSILSRGPYLQLGTSTSIIVKWKTTLPTESQVKIGYTSTTYFQTKEISLSTTDHEVVIDNLVPNTKYYYTIGDSHQVLQGDEQNYFTTYPASRSERSFRFWITGDCGNNSPNQLQVRDQYLKYTGSESTDGWLLLGDNAYSSGLEAEYDQNFFLNYQENIMKHTVLWPVPGNHDYGNNPVLQDNKLIPYYSLFTVPTEGEAGGVASKTESYYSYNIGNIHFIALDSYGEESDQRLYDTLSKQVVWLKKDLAANQQTWTIAYWHHPPYTKGSHDSDSENELVKIREGLLKILERSRVDLVLCGHSHAYERSRLMKGHYGTSDTYNINNFALSSSSGIYDGSTNSCPYIKEGSKIGGGIVYVVAGSSGQLGGSIAGFPHSAMVYSNRTQGGSLILEVVKNRLDLKWLSSEGTILDAFTMMKGVGRNNILNLLYGEPIKLTASWLGTYMWNNSVSQLQTITATPKTDTLVIVKDTYECLTDSFKITVDRITELASKEVPYTQLYVYPNPANEMIVVKLPHGNFYKIDITDLTGREITTFLVDKNNSNSIELFLDSFQLKKGTYLVNAWEEKKRWVKKLVIK